jgi:hypothetical protein
VGRDGLDVICPRHGFIATNAENGWVLCVRCFREAAEHADAVEVERIIARIRDRVRFEFGRKP